MTSLGVAEDGAALGTSPLGISRWEQLRGETETLAQPTIETLAQPTIDRWKQLKAETLARPADFGTSEAAAPGVVPSVPHAARVPSLVDRLDSELGTDAPGVTSSERRSPAAAALPPEGILDDLTIMQAAGQRMKRLSAELASAQEAVAVAFDRIHTSIGSIGQGHTNEQQIDHLRTYLRESHLASQAAQELLLMMMNDSKASIASRKHHMYTMQELIGPPPDDRTWRDEWEEARHEELSIESHSKQKKLRPGSMIQSGAEQADDHAAPNGTLHEPPPHKQPPSSLEDFLHTFQKRIDERVEMGWRREHAEAFTVISNTIDRALTKALRFRKPRFAASTYALIDALMDVGARQENERRVGDMPPNLYINLQGDYGLSEYDPPWLNIEHADHTGFCGLTSLADVRGYCDPECFHNEGFIQWVQDPSTGARVEKVLDSPIVCIESKGRTEMGMHAAIMIRKGAGDFPPNTLFRLKRTVPAGEWRAPGGLFPKQKLVVVSATYRLPRGIVPFADTDANHRTKLCGTPVTLEYAGRKEYVHGLEDIITSPVFTMEQEFKRDLSWRDWKGVCYTLKSEWAYVNGAAVRKENCTVGTRDELNEGKLPNEFMDEINDLIRRQRARGYSGCMPEDFCYLSLDEVLALRLYSGPAYQPINTFLRQIMKLDTEHRVLMARHRGITFASTVGHICNAIRKIAAVNTPEQSSMPLFRALRGEMPRSFWSVDGAGLICATDTAFMSTSQDPDVPLVYMDPDGPNVLWELEAGPESDTGFHCGADIARLSQFRNECEVLFPPCTMLLAKRHRGLPRLSPNPLIPSRNCSSNLSAGSSAVPLTPSRSRSHRAERRNSSYYQHGFSAEEAEKDRAEAETTAMSAEQLYQKTLDDFSVEDEQEGKAFRRIRARPTFV